jgi:hypothetical protein
MLEIYDAVLRGEEHILRIEFLAQPGPIHHFEGGKQVRTTFAQGHSQHGEEMQFEDGKIVKRSFALGHAQHGEELHYEDGHEEGDYKRTYAPDHAHHGAEEQYKGWRRIKATNASGHSQQGIEEFFDFKEFSKSEMEKKKIEDEKRLPGEEAPW